MYHPPVDASSLHRAAISAKSFRVFGLDDPAWRRAREEDRGGLHDGGEDGELDVIRRAIETALSEEAGGHGTAGFHPNRASDVQLTSDNGTSSFHANLIPYDGQSNEPLDPSSVLSVDEETGDFKLVNNDESHLTPDEEGGETPKFQLRVNVSRAREGLAAKAYYEALYAKRRALSVGSGGSGEGEFDVDAWVEGDEELRDLRQQLVDAREHSVSEEGNEEGALGYYVELLLVEPHVKPSETVIAPPGDMDKSSTLAKASNFKTPSMRRICESNNDDDGGDDKIANSMPRSLFQTDVYASKQFLPPGPWENANVKAYLYIVLDVRKSLVRVEFPIFPEGCKDKTFREIYQLNARLKSGSFATVCRGTHRATGKKIAVKCVLRKDLPPSDDASIYDEVLILSTLRHSYICPLIDFFEEPDCYFLVMELMAGGDLFDRIGKRKNYTENDARDLCRKMLESLRYIHENSVAHCDMKPKNLLLMSDDNDVQIKLADFGFATRVYEPESLTKQCGTPFFVAPEVLLRSPYDQQSDMWSCGVIIFLLLAGELPFQGRSQKELFRNIVMGKYEFEEELWEGVSEEAQDLVRKLLVTDPSQRLTSRDAMASPWMRQRGQMLAKNNLQFTSQRLKGFNAKLKLRSSMIAVSSVVSMTLSMKKLRSERALSATKMADKRPSFLDLPIEGVEDPDGDDKDGP